MDTETRKAFDNIDTKFDSLNIETQNNNNTIKQLSNDVTEIKGQILQNCAKLDTQGQKLDKIIKHLGLE